MGWRVAHSLETLRDQINTAHPGRSKASDGTIGDAAHAASVSDHNPDGAGVVRALDITHDPAHGVDIGQLAVTLLASRDTRIKYVIWQRHIVSATTSPWIIRPYTGSDPHTNHLHVSVVADSRADDTRPWSIGLTNVPTLPDPGTPGWPGRYLRNGHPQMTGNDVRTWQQRMRDRGWSIAVDGAYGPASESVCRRFQAEKHLSVDGIVGPATWTAAWKSPVT